jgi:hypothetical protein
MDHKTFAPADLKLSETGQITLAFAQLNVIDKDGDVTLPGAIPAKQVPMSAYGHTSWDGALPVGRGGISEANGWGVFDGQFLMDTTHGRDAYLTVKAMAELQEYSYGYRPAEFSFGEQDGKQVRFLKSLDIFEVSPVLVGAGVGTHTLAIKSGGPDDGLPYAEHVVWVLDQVKALVDRTSDRAELRLKEGRTLSGATLDQLTAISDQLGASSGALKDFLAANQPPPKADERLAREIEVLIARARRRGVQI